MDISSDTIVYNRYRLQRRLGRGSFGEVWSAHDEVADVDVALKIYVALDDKGIEEFRSEFRNVINLVHTNILRPEYYDVSDSRPFLVMPLCRGSVETQSGSMSESELWRFIRDVSSGLGYLHSHDILHRDIKPANILINADGDYVISDFGISTRMRSTMRRSSMRQDKGMDTSGTIAYMAPELFTKSPSAVKATDIWALGATLYELMTGELLFFGQGGLVQLKGAELPKLPDRYSQNLREIVASCLSLDILSRPTASELTGYSESMLKGKKGGKPWKYREDYPEWHGLFMTQQGEKVREPWEDCKEADSEEKSDSRKTGRRAGSTSGEAGPHPNHPNSRLSKKKWIWPTLFLLLIISGSFAGYKLSLNKSSSAEISQQRQKDSLSKVEREQQAATETVVRTTTGMLNGHEWVDLGLSVLWATCNVGASSPSEYGDYYAWGETEIKSSYTKDNSKTYGKTDMVDISGNPQYDAATANWGSGWRMPTKAEFEELLDKCEWQWTELDGRKGYTITGSNGNSIFLPAAGFRDEASSLIDAGCFGTYWSSTSHFYEDAALAMILADNSYYLWEALHNFGYTVRPVLNKDVVDRIRRIRQNQERIDRLYPEGIKSAPTFGLG